MRVLPCLLAEKVARHSFMVSSKRSFMVFWVKHKVLCYSAGGVNCVFASFPRSSESHKTNVKWPGGRMQVVHQYICISGEELWAEGIPVHARDCKQSCSIFPLQGDMFFTTSGNKQICPLNQETLSLYSQAICYRNILIEGNLNKSCHCLCWWVEQIRVLGRIYPWQGQYCIVYQ